MNLFKSILIALGTLSLCIGIIGIVIPGLPTTPFLLLTASLYVKSSDRLYTKLISNRFVGSYIADFSQKRGMSFNTKFYAIAIMWAMIIISCVFLIKLILIQFIVSIIGIIGTIVMGLIVPTLHNSKSIT